MGDPRKIRKKYDTPIHPWQKERIEEEKRLISEYGLGKKREIWSMLTKLKNFKNQAKSLVSRIDAQAEVEKKQLLDKLVRLGLMKAEDTMDKVLGLEVDELLERRIQTVLVRKKLARSMKQARQFITHGHILIGNKKVTFPSYLVTLEEESKISFSGSSTLNREDHPERVIKETKEKTDKKKSKKEEDEPPAFSPEEIEAADEVGKVDSKPKSDEESEKEEKKEDSSKKDDKKEEKKESSKKDDEKSDEKKENKESSDKKE
jgi:small subunit ribosomal protein S4